MMLNGAMTKTILARRDSPGLFRIGPLHSCQRRALRKRSVIQSNSLLVGMLHWTEEHITSAHSGSSPDLQAGGSYRKMDRVDKGRSW